MTDLHLPTRRGRRPRSRPLTLLAAGAAVTIALAGCGSSSKTSSSTSATTAKAGSGGSTFRGSGPVSVLYAASLADLMNKQVGPAFDTATGYTFNGDPGDSGSLANMIKGKTQAADVFVSAAASKDALLMGSANGDLVSWYATFASTPLVLGYNPSSKFAADLKSKPWYQVLTEPGILIGRTDPATDPKGALAVKALQSAATSDDAPGLTTVASSQSNVFPEATLVGHLQAGQLDVGFFYASEAKAAGIPTVPLTGQDLQATYTITVPTNAPHPMAGAAFVDYLLGSAAKGPLTEDGFDLITPPKVTGTGVPSSLQSLLSGQ